MAIDQDTKMTDAEGGNKQQATSKKNAKRKGEEDKSDLSEEDLELKANLEMMVERIKDSNPAVQSTALDNISRQGTSFSPWKSEDCVISLKLIREASLPRCFHFTTDG